MHGLGFFSQIIANPCLIFFLAISFSKMSLLALLCVKSVRWIRIYTARQNEISWGSSKPELHFIQPSVYQHVWEKQNPLNRKHSFWSILALHRQVAGWADGFIGCLGRSHISCTCHSLFLGLLLLAYICLDNMNSLEQINNSAQVFFLVNSLNFWNGSNPITAST